MILIRATVALALCLAAEVALGYLFPASLRFVDVMLLPVAWYAMTRSQRSGMLVGCAAGCLQDAWFQAGVFGVRGFSKTLLGWLLGGLAARFDINVPGGRLVVGMILPVADGLMEVGLLRLLDQAPGSVGATELLIRAVVGGVLFSSVFAVVDRAQDRELGSQALRRRA